MIAACECGRPWERGDTGTAGLTGHLLPTEASGPEGLAAFGGSRSRGMPWVAARGQLAELRVDLKGKH